MLNPWTISQSTYGGFGVSPDHSHGMSPNSTPHRRDSLNSDPHRIHQNHFKQNNFMYHGVNSNINSPQPGKTSAGRDGARPRRPTCGRFHALTRTCFSDPTDK